MVQTQDFPFRMSLRQFSQLVNVIHNEEGSLEAFLEDSLDFSKNKEDCLYAQRNNKVCGL